MLEGQEGADPEVAERRMQAGSIQLQLSGRNKERAKYKEQEGTSAGGAEQEGTRSR